MADRESITAKACSKCKQTLPRSHFGADKRATTGLQPRCRECCRVDQLRRYHADVEASRAARQAYYAANKEKVLAKDAEHRARHPERFKARKALEYQRIKDDPDFQAKRKAYAEANKERKREYDKRRRAERPEMVTRVYEWIKKNPDRRKSIVKAYDARRRSSKAQGDSTATIHAWEMAAKKVCYWCKARCANDYHIDHYVPLSKGGAHMVSNLVIACPRCNLKKNAKDPYEFAQSKGMLF